MVALGLRVSAPPFRPAGLPLPIPFASIDLGERSGGVTVDVSVSGCSENGSSGWRYDRNEVMVGRA